jgi:hypothetical protein
MRRYRGEQYDSAEELVASIDRHLQHMSSYAMWTIGTARNADRRYEDLGEPPFWAFWMAASAEIARGAKEHFVARGMKPDSGSTPGDVVYLY